MTPQYLPDYKNNCLLEQPRMKEPERPRGDSAVWDMDDFRRNYAEWKNHIDSLRSFLFDKGITWKEGELVEGKDFVLKDRILPGLFGTVTYAYPIPVKQEPPSDAFVRKHLGIIKHKLIVAQTEVHLTRIRNLIRPSIEHFLSGGNVNGMFLEAIEKIVEGMKGWTGKLGQQEPQADADLMAIALAKYCSPYGKANPETYAYIQGLKDDKHEPKFLPPFGVPVQVIGWTIISKDTLPDELNNDEYGLYIVKIYGDDPHSGIIDVALLPVKELLKYADEQDGPCYWYNDKPTSPVIKDEKIREKQANKPKHSPLPVKKGSEDWIDHVVYIGGQAFDACDDDDELKHSSFVDEFRYRMKKEYAENNQPPTIKEENHAVELLNDTPASQDTETIQAKAVDSVSQKAIAHVEEFCKPIYYHGEACHKAAYLSYVAGHTEGEKQPDFKFMKWAAEEGLTHYLAPLDELPTVGARWVKAGTPPPSLGWYHTNLGVVEWANVGEGRYGNEEPFEKMWLNRNGGHVTKWLDESLTTQPISLNSKQVEERIKQFIQEIQHHIDTWSDEPGRAIRLINKAIAGYNDDKRETK